MNYLDYQNSRNKSWDILLDLHLNALPIKITDVCHRLGVEVRTFKMVAPVQHERNQRRRGSIDGHSRITGGHPLIVFNADNPPARCRFTIAHELGHILLGHLTNTSEGIWTEGLYRRMDQPSTPQEEAANVFASRLLAPACVLWGVGVTTAEQIARLCDISQEAAEYRLERMQLLYAREREFIRQKNRSCFLLHPKERAVYRQFREYIEQNIL